MNKYLIILAVFLISLFCAFFYGMHIEKQNTQTARDQLTEKEKELESANNKLGVFQSNMVSLNDLNKKLSIENDDLKKQFQAFVRKNNLQIKSIDDSVVSVNQKTLGEKTIVVEKNICNNANSTNSNTMNSNAIISYEWHDSFQRFQLKDPDIFEKNNEVFTAKQYFRIFGVILKQKNGSLETRRMVLQEVYPTTDANSLKNPNDKIAYKEIDGSKAELVDSEFEYTEDVSKSIFHPRAIVLFDSNKNLGMGAELLNFHNVGLNLHATLPADLQNIETGSLRLGAAYNFNFKTFQTNLGLGASVGTPYNNFFHSANGTVDLIFYLTN